MRIDEYLRLHEACVALAAQSQTLDVQIRWAKLANAVSIAANAGFIHRSKPEPTTAAGKLTPKTVNTV
jgi:hypothetical protein